MGKGGIGTVLKVGCPTLFFRIQTDNVGLQTDNVGVQTDNVCIQTANVGVQADNVGLQVNNITVQADTFCLQTDKATVQADNVCMQTDTFTFQTDKCKDIATQTSQRFKSGTWSGTQTHSTGAYLPKSLPSSTHRTYPANAKRPTS